MVEVKGIHKIYDLYQLEGLVYQFLPSELHKEQAFRGKELGTLGMHMEMPSR